jgi:hypothetical protein
MRLRTEIWVSAFLRACTQHDGMALVAARGQRDAGMVFVTVPVEAGNVRVFGPPPAGLADSPYQQALEPVFDPPDVTPLKAREYLDQQRRFDPDCWVVDVEYCKDPERIFELLSAPDWIAGD